MASLLPRAFGLVLLTACAAVSVRLCYDLFVYPSPELANAAEMYGAKSTGQALIVCLLGTLLGGCLIFATGKKKLRPDDPAHEAYEDRDVVTYRPPAEGQRPRF